MIPFNYRFHGHGSLKYLFKKGLSIRSKNFSIKYVLNKFNKKSRITVIVSKKISKSAVKRNRIRRRIYEIIRLQLPNFQQVFDLAIIVNNIDIEQLSHQELKAKIEDVLKQAEIIS